MSHQELMTREELMFLQSRIQREPYRRAELAERIAAAEQKITALSREVMTQATTVSDHVARTA